jgi:pimeloyl-ACP methyl ester carboxylesterase
LGAVVAIKSAINGTVRGKLVLVGLPGEIESNVMRLTLLIPVWIRRVIGSTRWGRSNVLIPVLRNILGIKNGRQDDKLLDDLATTDTRSLVDTNVEKEVGEQIAKLVPRIQNEHHFIYGAKDPLIDSTKEFVKNPIIIQDADHNVCTSQPEKTLEIFRSILG